MAATPAEIERLERYLHTHIPLTRAMGASIVSVDDSGVRLRAPIDPNINHRSTVFGGSAAALAILAGWTLIHVRLRERGFQGRIVIQRSEVDYLRPIHSDFEAFCPTPEDRDWSRFVTLLDRRGRSRIVLGAVLDGGEGTAGSFEGAYVAMASESSSGGP